MEEIRPDILSSDVPGDFMLWEWPGHRLPSGERIRLLTQERVQFTQRPPVICLCCSQDVLCAPHDQAWQHLNQPVDDPLRQVTGPPGCGHDKSGRRIVLRRTGGGAADPNSLAALRTCRLTTSTSIRSLGRQPRMSHNAASVSVDSRWGTWVTSRYTCSRDRWMPRSASSDTRSEVWNRPFSAIRSRRCHRIPIFRSEERRV